MLGELLWFVLIVFLGLVRVSNGGAAEKVNQHKGRKQPSHVRPQRKEIDEDCSFELPEECNEVSTVVRELNAVQNGVRNNWSRNASRAILFRGMSLLENSATLELIYASLEIKI